MFMWIESIKWKITKNQNQPRTEPQSMDSECIPLDSSKGKNEKEKKKKPRQDTNASSGIQGLQESSIAFCNWYPCWPAKCKILSESRHFSNQYLHLKQPGINCNPIQVAITPWYRQPSLKY
jgi:hypothetical protein